MEQIDAPVRGRELALVHPFRFEGYTGRCHVTVPTEETGAPVMFLTGAFQGPRSMRSAIDHFGGYCVTLTVEPPGSDGDEVLPARLGFDWLARSLIELMDNLRLESVDIVAASYATPLAYCLASVHPDRVGRVVLAGATTGFDPAVHNRVARTVDLLEAGEMDEFAELVCDLVINTDPTVHVVRRRQVWRLMERQLRKLSDVDAARYAENTRRVLDAPRRLAHVDPPTVPVLVYTGEHDRLTPPASGRRLQRRLPQGVFTAIRNTDHLFFLEDPQTAIELAARFFADRLHGPLDSTTALEGTSTPEPAIVLS